MNRVATILLNSEYDEDWCLGGWFEARKGVGISSHFGMKTPSERFSRCNSS